MKCIIKITAVFLCILLLAGCARQAPASSAASTPAIGETVYVPVPGKSAYEIALDHGFMGTEEDWLASLQNSNAELEDALDHLFRLEEDYFEKYSETCSNPGWNYTTSTFSGWGGSIGTPAEVDTIRFRVRAREEAITQIKVFLTENDKSGTVLYEQILDVNIQPKEAAYVCWTLPEVFENTNEKTLYFTYNCNAFCDVWTNLSHNIPQDQYQAVLTYATNGTFLTNPSKMTNVVGSPCRYLYVELGKVRDVYVFDNPVDTIQENINVFLPDRYELVVGDNFQLFYRGVVQAVNPYNYYIRVTCAKGSAYPRYYEWKPTANDVGSHKLTLEIYDNNHNLLGTDTTTLVVKEAAAPTQDINVLCVGDSLTAGGYWPREMCRRLTETGGTPSGHGFSGINFVGRKSSFVSGNTIHFEGTGGWTWSTYLSEKSPFYNPETGSISFRYYCEQNGIEDLDIVYFLLTWNGQGTPFKVNFNLETGHFADAQKLLDILHEEYPDAIAGCLGLQMPSQNGGMGANYGASGGYSDTYGMLVTAMHYNAALEDLCQLEKYRDFVKYVDVAGQFDTDYNMPSKEKPVNNRSETTEIIGTNGVHPTINGYYQIADAAYRALCHDILAYFSE